VHLHKTASAILRKEHINEVDITYLNTEVDHFFRKLDKDKAGKYDPAEALGAIQRIPEEMIGDKAVFVAKFILEPPLS
jgi:hypothetical protein